MLTERRKLLYEYIKGQAMIDEDKWITQKEICDAMPLEFTLNHKAVKKMCCSYIHREIMEINKDQDVHEIILYKNQTYRLAKNQDEARIFLREKLLHKGLRMLKSYWNLMSKVSKDGQLDFNGEEFKTFIANEIMKG